MTRQILSFSPHSHLRVAFFCPVKTEKKRVSEMRNVPRLTIKRTINDGYHPT